LGLVLSSQESLKELYGKGVTDGMEIVLSLLLGRESHGGIPYQGRLDPAAQNWAMDALAAIHATRKEKS
jgi:hypothetical protein